MSKTLFFAVFIGLTTACATNSGVIPIGQDTFLVSRQAGSGFGGLGALKGEAFKEASAYCVGQDKTLQIVTTNESQPPYILGNYPRVELQFMCLNNTDSELNRPKLMPIAPK